MASPASDHPADISAAAVKETQPKGPKKAGKMLELAAHVTGEIVPLEQVDDDVFSQGILGRGIAVEPSEGKLYSPADGVVENVFDTKHAIGIMSDDGMDLLLHIGIDTVKLNGQYFKLNVKKGDHVKRGQLLGEFDLENIRKAGYAAVTPLIICNTDRCGEITPAAKGSVTHGQTILKVRFE